MSADAVRRRLLSANAVRRRFLCLFSDQHVRLRQRTDSHQDLAYRRVARLHDGHGGALRHAVFEVNARCVVSYVLQHVVVLWSIVKTDDAEVVPLIDVVRLVDRW